MEPFPSHHPHTTIITPIITIIPINTITNIVTIITITPIITAITTTILRASENTDTAGCSLPHPLPSSHLSPHP